MFGAALVLNMSYEPLGVVSQRRAVVLVVTGKAVPVQATDEVLHSEHLALQAPAVVRLTRFVRVPYRANVPIFCPAFTDPLTRASFARCSSKRRSSSNI